LAGSGTINGSVTTTDGTTLSPGTNGVIGTLTINNDLTLGGGNLVFDVGNGSGNHDLVNVGGTLAMNSGTVIINVVGGSLNPGVYPLFHYTGGITGASANLGLVIPAGISATLIVDTPNHNLVLLVSMF
jgi:fibronectin-binding autotransporter adhesin